MPTSAPDQISTILPLALSSRPRSVLDVGIGFGKYGFLSREYLELFDGRNVYGDWRVRIDGIEAHEEYVGPLQRMIYNDIFVGDALQVLPTLDTVYDVILLIDILEHLTREDADTLLVECSRKSQSIVVATPKEPAPQGAVFNNEFETHRSVWRKEDFKPEHLRVVDHPTQLIMRFESPPSGESLLRA